MDSAESRARQYRRLVLGRNGLWAFLRYELTTLLVVSVPGALGFYLRQKLYPGLLGACGGKVSFGRNVTIRHGHKIHIGSNVIIDDNVVLDAKGDNNAGITIGDSVMISRNTVLSCKGGDIQIANDISIGINAIVHACTGSDVRIGRYTVVAAFTYLIGGGLYVTDRLDVPMKLQGVESRGGITVGEDVWIGANVQILDGVEVGNGSILAAGAVVTRDVEPFSVTGGVPAKLLRKRESTAESVS